MPKTTKKQRIEKLVNAFENSPYQQMTADARLVAKLRGLARRHKPDVVACNVVGGCRVIVSFSTTYAVPMTLASTANFANALRKLLV